MRTQIISVMFLITLSGCTISNPFEPTTEKKIEKAEFTRCKIGAQINQKTRQFVTGVKEVLELKEQRLNELKQEGLNKEERISLDLILQAERLLGGEPIEKMDVNSLVVLYGSDKTKPKYERIISEKEKTVTLLRKNELDNQITIAALEQQLEREKAEDTWWNRIKRIGISSVILMIIALILLLIFAPNVLGWLIAKIPSLIFYLGVTSARVVKALVKGVQKARAQIADMPDDTKLNKYEILDMIDRGLKEEADGETTKTVEVLRKKYNLESISQKLKSRVANISRNK